jgi:ribonuclease T1
VHTVERIGFVVVIRTRRPLLALCALLAALGVGYGVKAIDGGNAKNVVASPTVRPTVAPTHSGKSQGVALSSLPSQATDTVALIRSHGPFPYPQDGVVFGNFEGLLPAHVSGYYHEYTVKTPGSRDRGARRIITGSKGEYYYTDDHYSSFVIVDIGR